MNFAIEALSNRHERQEFDCGELSLNEYLKRYAAQNMRRDTARTYVAVELGAQRVWGYYTLSSGSIVLDAVPEGNRGGLPRLLPVVLLGRLAVDRSLQGQRLGHALVYDAFQRVMQVAGEIGVCAVEVWALTPAVRDFYSRFYFQPLLDDPLHLYLPMKLLRQWVGENQL